MNQPPVILVQNDLTLHHIIKTADCKGLFEKNPARRAKNRACGPLRELSRRLTEDFGKGFDERNLRFMRQFYLAFPIRNALRTELSWTHYRRLSRVADSEARMRYMNECAKSNWSTRQLEQQIKQQAELIAQLQKLAGLESEKPADEAQNKEK